MFRITNHTLCSPTKGPCAQIVYPLAPVYLNRDDFKAKVYTIWLSGFRVFGLGILGFRALVRIIAIAGPGMSGLERGQ